MIITLYKDKFFNGIGGEVKLNAGDTITRRLPDDTRAHMEKKLRGN